MPWRSTPEKKFSAVQGCPRSCARTNPWLRGRILGGNCAQEPLPGSAVKHCRFLGTGGGCIFLDGVESKAKTPTNSFCGE